MASKYDELYKAVSRIELDFFSSVSGRPSFTDTASNGDRILKYYSDKKGCTVAERKQQAEEFYQLIKHVHGVKKVVVRNATASRTHFYMKDGKPMTDVSTWDDYDKVCVYVNILK